MIGVPGGAGPCIVAAGAPDRYTSAMRPSPRISLLLAAGFALTGCGWGGSGGGRGDLAPRDFVAPRGAAAPGGSSATSGSEPAHDRMDAAMEAARQGEIGVDVPLAHPATPPRPRQPAEPVPPERARPGAGDDPSGAAPPSVAAPPVAAPAGDPLPLAGMVGQVNGRAIYARSVFEPIGEQLAALGRELPPSAFRQRAGELIRATLDQIVTDALILGEAERDLDERQRSGLDWMAREYREELLRKHGQGSVSLAEARLREETGKGIEETVAEYRHRRIIEHHLRNEVLPRINVTRRDIERYYHDHPQEFNPEPKRTLRLIRVADDEAAADIGRRLEAGEPFADVAASDANLNRPESGGLMETGGGEQVFDNPDLNRALLSLEKGQWAGPVSVGQSSVFLYLEEVVTGEQRSLRDVQIQIERRLREEQYRMLSARERERLVAEGNYHPLDDMVQQLVSIAVARYSTPRG